VVPDGFRDEPATAARGSRSWEVAAVLGGGYAQTIGRFQYFVADHRWVWSDEVARIHGYEPGQVEPTTELLLSHKHPDDRAEVAEILQRVNEGGLFSSRHRIVDAAGRIHWVVVVGDHLMDDAGQAIGTQGYYIDVSAGLQADLTKAMEKVLKSREIIDQAKGALMVAYGIGADRAFDILTWRSQATQRKLRDVAADFVSGLTRAGLSADSVKAIDSLLLANDQPAD
jgi:PAS domain S-box-containing protein